MNVEFSSVPDANEIRTALAILTERADLIEEHSAAADTICRLAARFFRMSPTAGTTPAAATPASAAHATAAPSAPSPTFDVAAIYAKRRQAVVAARMLP